MFSGLFANRDGQWNVSRHHSEAFPGNLFMKGINSVASPLLSYDLCPPVPFYLNWNSHGILEIHYPLTLMSALPSCRFFIIWRKKNLNLFKSWCLRNVSVASEHKSFCPWMEEPGRLQSMGSLRVRRDWATLLSLFTFTQWRRQWRPTPVFLPGESQGWQSLVCCRLWGRTELDTTEVT